VTLRDFSVHSAVPCTGYVQQDDLFMATLTVEEHLIFQVYFHEALLYITPYANTRTFMIAGELDY
jgi:hypothetical protein